MEKNEVKEEVFVSDGGHKYILKDGLKVRDSLAGGRLKDDGETFEEYKARQKMVKYYTKEKLKGNTLWFGGRGTYVKKEVEAYVKQMLEQKKKEMNNE